MTPSVTCLWICSALSRRRPDSAASPPQPLSWAPRNRPISQQIKRLEEQLATRLFDRIYRGIELTEAGDDSF
jgi:hypothetical protein